MEPAAVEARPDPELAQAWKEMFGYTYDDVSEAHTATVMPLKKRASDSRG